MTKQLKLSALLVALLASFASVTTFADSYATKDGYAADVPTDAVSRNNYGECWKTNYSADFPVPAECGGVTTEVVTEEQITTEKVSLSADVLFAFDKADLRPGATNILHEAIAKGTASGARLIGIRVVGHTDAIGSDKYNDALSLRRAHSVRNFLINAGVSADQVTAEGRGKREAQMTAQCEREVAQLGKKISAAKKRQALIACLQPDRKVELLFDGQKTITRTIERTITK